MNGKVQNDAKWSDAYLKANNFIQNPYVNINLEGTQLISPVMRDVVTNSKIEPFTNPVELTAGDNALLETNFSTKANSKRAIKTKPFGLSPLSTIVDIKDNYEEVIFLNFYLNYYRIKIRIQILYLQNIQR